MQKSFSTQVPFSAPLDKEEILFSYTRAEALKDGFQVDVSTVAKEAGIRFPVFLTNTVYDEFVKVPEGVTGQDTSGRLWDILYMLRQAIFRDESGAERLPFKLYVRNSHKSLKLINLISECGPLDFDDPQPAITVTMPDED